MKFWKETFFEKTNNNKVLFICMLIWVFFLLELISRFYNYIIVWWIPFLIIDKYFIPWDVLWDNKMYVTSMLFGLTWIWIIIYLFKDKFILAKGNRLDKWYYKMVFITVIWVYVLFYITNPWYTLQTHPRLFLYQDGKNITNKW